MQKNVERNMQKKKEICRYRKKDVETYLSDYVTNAYNAK